MNFATTVVTEFGSINRNTYLEILNIDKYDCILGTPFLRKHGISLDFEHQEIVICGRLCIPALPEGEGKAEEKPPKTHKNDYKENNLAYWMWIQLKLNLLSPDKGR